jgi:hypothetical protein
MLQRGDGLAGFLRGAVGETLVEAEIARARRSIVKYLGRPWDR